MRPSPDNIQVRTLTTEYTGIPKVITSPVDIAPAFLPGIPVDALPHMPLVGIWDTGATNTVITQHIIEIPKPTPGRDEVLVKVIASSVNAGEEKVIDGDFVGRFLQRWPS